MACTLSACGGASMWPFGEDEVRTRGPAGSTEYVCDKDRKFYVLIQDSGNTVWLALPDRELSLEKGEAAGQYGNGITKLVIEGDTAQLDDGYKHDFNNCQVSAPAKK
ncbi:hypothetical protein SAMN05192560_0197 [Methylobacillus rhizosphaerae]|uniref:Membrane-bound lysozyme-inhibitor of c-type lysozyme n=1 Tax=Methylobacillus rhizosphaerae TaxID=551994 RepID=A0A238XU50_9PROT|nr:hypothetical protein SAMN05192560_0197 [Methylobacillus rhizosphaerae]